MKAFAVVALISTFNGAFSRKSLEAAYGHLEPVPSMLPRRASQSRVVRPPSFFSRRSAEQCNFPFQILIAQDQTSSFADDYAQMTDVQLPQMVEVLSATHPDTVYGIAAFQDKPILPFGIPPTAANGHYSDFCLRFASDFTADVETLTSYYGSHHPNGGGDPAENQFGAFLGITQSSKISWSDNDAATKLVVLITDSPPHFEDDGGPMGTMVPCTGVFDDSNPDEQCLREYYPNPGQVVHSLNRQDVYLATLVYDPAYWNGLPASSWQWFNRYYNQTDDFVNLNAADSSNFWENLAKVIRYIEDLECAQSTVAPTSGIVEPTTAPVDADSTGDEECPPCPPEDTCPPCMTPPPRPEECSETVLCEEGVYVNLGFKPEVFDLNVDGKQVDL